ncbi:hypothetical protein [Acidipropionibacterium jensenii]|uniref:hypothetical protein n=1 Tax=Acidipropionibacterium jensenii TaxID=1749 RepID=UPI000BC36571|nr:hypothetical protein [Acidipropionibacterium jensenii]
MAQPTFRASRIVPRSVLIVVTIVSGLGLLASLLYGAMAQDANRRTMSMEVAITGGLPRPSLGSSRADVQYSSVMIYSLPGLTRADPLVAVATAIPYLVGGLTCLVVLVLAVQMLRRRELGLGVAVAMLTIAALCIASGIARPALEARAEQLYVTGLGLPTSWQGHQMWLVLNSRHPLGWGYWDWPLIVLGLLIALGGWLVLRARQLRLDLEGTI